jgi:hypothetical protein
MNFLTINPPGKSRIERTQDRNEHIVLLLKDNRPTRAIAEMKGLAFDYCRDLCRELVILHDLDYNPSTAATSDKSSLPFGLTEQSRAFRAATGTLVYNLREILHFTDVGNATGLSNADQSRATEGQGVHDYKLSQMERLAEASGMTFRDLVLKSLLTKEEYERVSKCLNI